MSRQENNEMPFLDHLEELRGKLIKSVIALIVGVIICFIVAQYILEFLKYPATRLDPPLLFQFLKVQAIFIVYIEIGFFGGITLALPFIIYQLWSFVAPGLHSQEKKYFIPMVAASTFLFLVGIFFAYYIILPLALTFFVNLAPEGIRADIAIDEYIGFAIRLMFLFGIIFELPMLSFTLAKVGILRSTIMRTYRRHGIVAIFIVAAMLTPPDPITQVFLGIPLILLYELSVYIVRGVERGREKAALEAEAEYQAWLEKEQKMDS